jgi:hypothetical protein
MMGDIFEGRRYHFRGAVEMCLAKKHNSRKSFNRKETRKKRQKKGCPLATFTFIYPRYVFNNLLRDVCLKRRIAFSFIWRTRSRVNPNRSPISSNVIS